MKVETFNKAMALANFMRAVDFQIEKFEKQINEDFEFLDRANLRVCFDGSSFGGGFNTNDVKANKDLPEDVREGIVDIVDSAAHRIHDLLKRKKQNLKKNSKKFQNNLLTINRNPNEQNCKN